MFKFKKNKDNDIDDEINNDLDLNDADFDDDLDDFDDEEVYDVDNDLEDDEEIHDVDDDLEDIKDAIEKLQDCIDNFNSTQDKTNLLLINLLHEIQKSNLILNQQKSTLCYDKEIPQINLNEHKNYVIVRDSYLSVKNFLQNQATKLNIKLHICDNCHNMADLAALLSWVEENEYVLVNCNHFVYDGNIEEFYEVLQHNTLVFIVGKGDSAKPMSIKLKPINYILYSDTLELVDPALIKGFTIV